jgi:hypothetical protein
MVDNETLVNHFKAGRGISVHKLSGESSSVSKSAVDDWYLVLAEILKTYAPTDVYNAD